MLRNLISVLLIVLMPSTITIAQAPSTDTKPNQDAKSAQTTEAAAPKPAMQGFGLEDGTPVKIRTARTISSADAHTGDTLDFEVLEDVLVKDTLVIPKGGIAWGTVTDAQPKRRMGRGGKLDVNIDAVRLVDGEKVPLRAVKDVKGGGHTGAMTGAMVGTAIVFFPAAPLFLFMHGKDITIPKGTEITAYINGNTRLDEAKFKAATPGTVATAPVTTSTALLDISSTPAGADIEIDGKFVGSTPSSISLSPGDHDIVVKKAGFSAWQKKMSVSAGHITLAAELVAESK
jgi:PEGA domain